MSVDPRLLSILVCPACRHPDPLRQAEAGLTCSGCGRVYPVRDGGVPVLLVDDAEPTRTA